MSDKIDKEIRKPASIPRIDIRKTTTNDIRLILDLLLPTKNLARLARSYQTLLSDHHAEIRLIHQVINKPNGNCSKTMEESEDKPSAEDVERLNSHKVLWISGNGSILR